MISPARNGKSTVELVLSFSSGWRDLNPRPLGPDEGNFFGTAMNWGSFAGLSAKQKPTAHGSGYGRLALPEKGSSFGA
jgi:hypothetical protein